MTAVPTSEVSPEDAVLPGAASAPTRNGLPADLPGPMAPSAAAGRAEVVERASVAERRIYALEERLAEVELRLREQVEAERQKELELRAVERDVAVKEAYAQRLEAELVQIRTELGLTHNHAANLEAVLAARDAEIAAHAGELATQQAALAAAEARAAELGALVGTIQQQASYKLAVGVTNRLRHTGPLFGVVRRVVRAARRG